MTIRPRDDDHEATAANKANGGTTKKDDSEKKFRDFAEVTKGAEKIDGLFTLHHKDEHLYAEIKPNQFDQPMLAPIAIARGMAMAGQPLNFGDEWVLLFKRVGDKVQLIRRNIHYKAPAGSPLEKAVKQNYTDSILMALPIVSINHSGGNERRDRPGRHLLHRLRRARASATSTGTGRPGTRSRRSRTTSSSRSRRPSAAAVLTTVRFGDDGVADRRGRTIVIHYSLAKLPDSGYKPRYADDRVGHFLSATKDFGSNDPDTNFVRQINRWRLEKVGPQGQALAAEEAAHLVRRETRSRTNTGRTSRRASSSGTRRSRRSASATRSRSAGRRMGATTSTPRTSTTAPSAGSRPA